MAATVSPDPIWPVAALVADGVAAGRVMGASPRGKEMISQASEPPSPPKSPTADLPPAVAGKGGPSSSAAATRGTTSAVAASGAATK
eukprot:4947572-Prymnesium_polylepis.1